MTDQPTPKQLPPLTYSELRDLATHARVTRRTVVRYLRGERAYPLTEARIVHAARVLGIALTPDVQAK